MDVRFYNYEHELIAIEAQKISVNWNLCYNGVGTFEMAVNAHNKSADSLLKNDFLVAVWGKRSAVITSKTLSGNTLTLYGRTPEWLLERKIALPAESMTKEPGEIVKSLLPDFMEYKDERTSLSDDVEFAINTPESAEEAIKRLLDAEGLGHEVVFSSDDKGCTRWIFRIYEGHEQNNPLSEESKTVSSLVLSIDMLEYASHGYFNREQADGKSTWEEVVKDEAAGVYRSEKILNAENLEDAKRELDLKRIKRAVTGAARRLKFGRDYFLGDILTVKIERGGIRLSSKYRVTEVHIWEESETSGEEPILEEVRDEL